MNHDAEFRCGNCHVRQPTILGVVQHFDSCGKCGCKRYCSLECQVDHWKNGGHKEACSAVIAQSQKKINRAMKLVPKIISFISEKVRVKGWHAVSTNRMKQTCKRGLICVFFNTVDEAEAAARTSSVKGGIWTPEDIDWLSAIQKATIRAYNPECEFVVSVEIDDCTCVTGIINVNVKLTDISQNPFSDISGKHVILSTDDVAVGLVGEAARKKVAVFVKNCFKSMGVYRTPPETKERLHAYVKDEIECYDCVIHDGTAFVFALGINYQEFCDQKVPSMCQRYRKVVVLAPSAVDLIQVKAGWCLVKDRNPVTVNQIK